MKTNPWKVLLHILILPIQLIIAICISFMATIATIFPCARKRSLYLIKDRDYQEMEESLNSVLSTIDELIDEENYSGIDYIRHELCKIKTILAESKVEM